MNDIWYLPGPFHQYNENVKALAKSRGLRIVDANATWSREGAADNVPEVTIREELKPIMATAAGGESGCAIGGDTESAIKRDLDAVKEILSGISEGNIEEPEFGETARQLFASLVRYKGEMNSLESLMNSHSERAERIAKENSELLERIKALESSGADDADVVALKAKLTEAGVSFSANASKKALQKLVAEIPAE